MSCFYSSSLQPTLVACTWQLAVSAKDRAARLPVALEISPRDVNFHSVYYIGVYGHGVATEFDLSAQQVPATGAGAAASSSAAAAAAGYVLGSRGASSVPSSSSSSSSSSLTSVVPQKRPASTDPSAQVCDNCWQQISSAAFQMHTMHCARNNWRCDECGQVVPKKAKDAHAHCAQCGAVVDPAGAHDAVFCIVDGRSDMCSPSSHFCYSNFLELEFFGFAGTFMFRRSLSCFFSRSSSFSLCLFLSLLTLFSPLFLSRVHSALCSLPALWCRLALRHGQARAARASQGRVRVWRRV